MPKRLIAQRLKNAMGLHTPTVGMITVSSAIERRMRELNIETHDKYLRLLDENAHEMQDLIEAVIIPETWFFRDVTAYNKLLQYLTARKPSSPHDSGSPTRILSIPCSSGEEPYSIAMMLNDNSLNKDEYKIDAVDISENLIHLAQNGIYGKNSFRANDLSFVDRYFTRENDIFILSDEIKSRVTFHSQNLLDENFLPGHEIYDVIFCRNLLIYFDTPTQARVFGVLNRLLKNDGILVLGHAETSQKSAGLFTPANELGAYINRKSTPPQKAVHKETTQPVSISHFDAITTPKVIIEKESIPTSNKDFKNKLEEAFYLANEGRTDDAIKMSLAHIDDNRFSSRAHYLLGLLYDSNGDSDIADDYLKKSLYLNPNNIEALIHLSLMAEQRGDTEDSERLRNRAERVQNRNESQ